MLGTGGIVDFVKLAAAYFVLGVWWVWHDRRHGCKELKTLSKTRSLQQDEVALAGFSERETPRVQVLRAPKSTEVWLTFSQAKEVAAAFDWAKRTIQPLDEQHVRSRSVTFAYKWWRRGRVFELSVTDGRGDENA